MIIMMSGGRTWVARIFVGFSFLFVILALLKALDYYSQVVPRMKQSQDVRGDATTLNSIGLIYSRLGEKARTLDHYGRALTLIRQLGNPEEAVGLHNLAAAHADLRQNA